MTEKFTISITVNCTKARLWQILTDLTLIPIWMGGDEMRITVETDWQLNAPMVIRGFHHVAFENRGTVMMWEPERRLVYSHLSTVSRLPDLPESYSVIGFELRENNDATDLIITVSNFPTEIIRKHLEFYWRGTIYKIREMAERSTFQA
ncbi:SRPBCC domain-containing protein [Chitinophaga sp. Cy-1792]|uniref:SRPBCC family protein n=1 Tax=Chitinophaga sp. Cy-1792 TaxID=2608339 RepID=UPI00141DE734|nr:SRPBCC domain-containing protein [Chitinophaga sp. Cy-1792]NIG51877.1 SRPBCC domain-containing protein [Chitinophaga sp. Cy-1792]